MGFTLYGQFFAVWFLVKQIYPELIGVDNFFFNLPTANGREELELGFSSIEELDNAIKL